MVRKNRSDGQDYCPPSQSTSRHRPRTWAAHQNSSLRKVLLTNKKKRDVAGGVDTDIINIPYYEDFRSHVGDVRAHMAGTHEEEEGPSLVNHPFIESRWTSTEKDAFFHALSTSSRLRPDMIAASIKTKSIFEVCIYMKALEEGLAELKTAELESDEEHPDQAVEDDAGQQKSAPKTDAQRKNIHSEQGALQRRASLPFAHEMSIPWVKFEDRLSRPVCRLDDGPQAGRVDARSRKGEEPRTSNLSFVNAQLQILESILRNSQDVLDATAGTSSPRRKKPRSASVSANSIDAQQKSAAASKDGEDDELDDEEMDSYIWPRPEMDGVCDTPRRREATEEETPEVDFQHMSPAARRRLHNRMYMRKQRALKRGIPLEAVDTTSVRLRPGRHSDPARRITKASLVTGKRRKRAVLEEDDEGTDSDDGTRRGESKYRRYKLDFADAGIDGKVIIDEALGYFNLTALGKMMNLFTSGYRDSLTPGRAAISSDLIRSLLGVVVEFTAEVIHRAVVLSETHNAIHTSKKETRDWVSVSSINAALQMMGQRLEDRKTHLGRMLDEVEMPEDSHPIVIEKGKGKQMNDSVGDEPTTTPTTSNRLQKETVCRQIYKPIIHLPKKYLPQEKLNPGAPAIMRFSISGHEPLEDSEGEGPLDGEEEELDETVCVDSILPRQSDSTEDKEYERQMVEEAELDATDMMETREYEQELWEATLVA